MNIFLLYDNFYIEVINVTMGERIKAARKRVGLTQEQLAKKCEIATITIGQYERNKRQPRIEQLQAIADALNISFDNLLNIGKLPTKTEIDSGTPCEIDNELQEFDAFINYLEDLGYKLFINSIDVETFTEFIIFDQRKNEAYSVSMREFSSLQLAINSYSKFQISELLAGKNQVELTEEEQREMLDKLLENRGGEPQEPPASPSECTDTTPTENDVTEPSEGK